MKTSINMTQVTQRQKPPIDQVALFQEKLARYLKNRDIPPTEELKATPRNLRARIVRCCLKNDKARR